MKLIFEFVGGSRDGRSEENEHADYVSRSSPDNVYGSKYWIDGKGISGKRVMQCTEYSLTEHGKEPLGSTEKYEAFEQRAEGDTIFVKWKFVGTL